MSKNSNDKNNFNYAKSGKSNAKVDFIKGGMDFLDQEVLNDLESEEDLSDEDLDDPELLEFEESDPDEVLTIEEEISEEVKEVKTGKVTVVSRKVAVKKPVKTVNENVEKEVGQLAKDLVKDIPSGEAKKLLHMSNSQKDQLMNGNMDFLSRGKVSSEEKKEFMAKFDEISSSEEVSNANAAFVLKWLNQRK